MTKQSTNHANEEIPNRPKSSFLERIRVLHYRKNQRSGGLMHMDANGYIIDYIYIYFNNF
jgi:hypothetical protein